MSNFPDVMCDIETTGTSPDETAIIQIAAVRFNLRERTLDNENMFNRCLAIAPSRYWDESTREWWSKQKRDVLLDILARGEDPATVMRDFSAWASQGGQKLRFWSKPTTFDFMFCASYFRQFDVMNPFHYRNAVDMNSFLRGLGRSTDIPEVIIDFAGDAHNAIYDAINQIAVVFKAMDEVR